MSLISSHSAFLKSITTSLSLMLRMPVSRSVSFSSFCLFSWVVLAIRILPHKSKRPINPAVLNHPRVLPCEPRSAMSNPDSTHSSSPLRWTIQPEQVGERLDRYLTTHLTGLSRTTIQQLISDGSVLVNGRASKPGYPLRNADEVRVLQAHL